MTPWCLQRRTAPWEILISTGREPRSSSVSIMPSLRAAAVQALLVLALAGTKAMARTLPDQTAALLAFKQAMLPLGPHWEGPLQTWTCPTPNTSNPDGSCDPCGTDSWWGWFDHVGCRGDTGEAKDILGGNGYVTKIHITDVLIEGSLQQVAAGLCPLKHLKEFDVDGGLLSGPIPEELVTCFPEIDEIDLSYNLLTGTIPAFIGSLTDLSEFKAEHNNLSGTVPPELGSMAGLLWLRLANNKLEGSLPAELSKLSGRLWQFTVDSNEGITGDLYTLSDASLVNAGTTAAPGLCGMVPVGVRHAHGFNFHGTGLGLPCPEELAGGWQDLSEVL